VSRWQGFYDELATERYPALLAYASAFTGQRATAEDLVQEALVRTFSRPRRLASREHAEHYVRRSIASIFVDDKRREQVFRRTASRLASPETVPGADADAGLRDQVADALQGLAPQVRACVVLRYYDDLAVAQVADRLGLAVGTVKRYLHDASGTLRDALGAEPDEERVDVIASRSEGRR